jgi:ABC-type branched-subunit amino acid transport system permease subunit
MDFHIDAFAIYVSAFIAAILFWILVLRLFKIKSTAIALTLAYFSLVGYGIINGWNPVTHGAFSPGTSEIVRLSWPAVLLRKYLMDFEYLMVIVCALQYFIIGWIFDLLIDFIFGNN